MRTGGRGGRPGRAVLIRGRRRVGKSRLAEEFLERTGLPHVFFTAVGGSKDRDLAGFVAELATERKPFDNRDLSRLITHRSQLPGADDSTPLLAVARAGCTADGIRSLTPEDLIAAWS